MPTRIAGCLSLLSFAACLLAGGLGGDAAFGTILGRALGALCFTFVLGLLVGAMAQRMLEESLEKEAATLEAARLTKVQDLGQREPILRVGGDETPEFFEMNPTPAPPVRRAA